jgi:general secretion pathway protein I
MKRQRGFTLLEAIVALVILSISGLALYGWIATNLQNLQRLEAAQERAYLTRTLLQFAATLNPMLKPDGKADLGGYAVSWQSQAVQGPVDGVSLTGGKSLYQVGLYQVELQIRLPDQDAPLLTLKVLQPGHKQVMSPLEEIG